MFDRRLYASTKCPPRLQLAQLPADVSLWLRSEGMTDGTIAVGCAEKYKEAKNLSVIKQRNTQTHIYTHINLPFSTSVDPRFKQVSSGVLLRIPTSADDGLQKEFQMMESRPKSCREVMRGFSMSHKISWMLTIDHIWRSSGDLQCGLAIGVESNLWIAHPQRMKWKGS